MSDRFYGELASYWLQISPPAEYEDEADEIARLLGDVRTVLELGSGGGCNAFHLKDRYALTLTDLSPRMLEVSAGLNPGLEHVEGDMRTLRLGRTFDAVLVHDAISYMLTEDDLAAAFATARVHLAAGGLALFIPDELTETFEPGTDHGGTEDARYLEWTYDPDPADTWTQTEYAFLLRADGQVRAVHETHRNGLFPRATWLALLERAGFEARVELERTAEDRRPREFFVATASP